MSNSVEVLSAEPTKVVLCSGSASPGPTASTRSGSMPTSTGPTGRRTSRWSNGSSSPARSSIRARWSRPCRAPSCGSRWQSGDHVSAGDNLVAIEAMKMEHEIRASHGGVVAEVAVAPGDQVESGRLLVVIDEPGAVHRERIRELI